MAIQLVVGLGNPGIAYTKTRHNVGIWGLEKIAKNYELIFSARKHLYGLHAKWQVDGRACHLLIPTTFMNESGRAVSALIRYYKLSLEEVLVIHDDLDLLPGVVRLKTGGGSGGHNGIKSIVNICGNKHFRRLRVGIGHPGIKAQVSNYVLSQPSLMEYSKIQTALEKINIILPLLLKGNYALAMQMLHTPEP